jgi:hypothetical protein
MRQPETNRMKHICAACVHFQNNPAVLEKTFRGLSVMSSGFASVRAQDGLCNQHGIYLSARDGCPDFQPISQSDADLPAQAHGHGKRD